METANKSDSLLGENNSLCRVCLSVNEDNKCIFTFHVSLDHENDSRTDLCEKLQFYGGIEVSLNDGLPVKMCNECISKMHVAHEFRTQCQATDKMLRSIHSNSANKNDKDETERECVQSDEIENLCREESNIDTTKNEISACIDKVEDVKPVQKKDVSRTRTILVLKKVDSNIVKNSYQAYNKSPASLTFPSRSSGSVLGESINDVPTDIAKAKEDKSVSKKEGYRSRRVILFKRVTSMTNLKNNKERQRQYIKNRDNVENGKTSCTGVRKLPINVSSLPHRCSKCGRSYSSKKALESHAISHDYKKFSCDQCDEKYSRLDEFLKHAKSHDPNEKLMPVSCKICNKNFRKAITMVRHLNIHKRENPRAVYIILKDIRDRRKRKDLRMSGKDAAANAKNFEEMVLHDRQDSRILTQDNRSYVPEMTNANSNGNDTKPFDKRHSLSRDKMKFMCNVCNTKFLVADKLKCHREHYRHYEDNVSWEHNPPDDRLAIKLINTWIKEELDSDNEGKGFPCKNCSKSYATRKSLLKHEAKMHANFIVEYCPRCGENCICANRMKKSHKERQEKAYTCEECNKTFENQAKLEKHMRIHARAKEQQDSNFKRFLCHICSKTFRQNTGLMFHMRTHTGYKPHVCKYCGRGFTSNSNCINHERTHTGDRPFICHFCSAAFAKSCTLKAHITTHTGEANYHCKTCGKSFRRLKYLKEHRFTHTGEKPYACKLCGTAYSHSGSLFVHEKKCKAQEGNYQTVSVPISQNYCQPLPATIGTSSISPIITSLPSSQHISSIDNPLTMDATKNYIESMPRMNNSLVHPASDSADEHIHLNPDTGVVPSAVRSFTIIGQMFHT